MPQLSFSKSPFIASRFSHWQRSTTRNLPNLKFPPQPTDSLTPPGKLFGPGIIDGVVNCYPFITIPRKKTPTRETIFYHLQKLIWTNHLNRAVLMLFVTFYTITPTNKWPDIPILCGRDTGPFGFLASLRQFRHQLGSVHDLHKLPPKGFHLDRFFRIECAHCLEVE